MGRVLEWVSKTGTAITGGSGDESESDRVTLGLRDNEVAEIEIIQLDLYAFDDFSAACELTVTGWVSMDPETTWATDVVEDLETICDNVVMKSTEGILAGTECIQFSNYSFMHRFERTPVLVGTDLGLGLHADLSAGNLVAAGARAYCKIWFKRRKATAPELNQILLKRR